MEHEGKKYEEFAYVLDELLHGRLGAAHPSYHSVRLIQIIGETFFTLLEAEPKRDATFTIRERIYVGKSSRTKISHIMGRISYSQLTSTSKAELPFVVETVIKSEEGRFIDFFNRSQPITPRMHAMELIPGIGKKLMWQILDQMDRKPFIGFDDLQNRVNLSDPAKLLAKRVLEELQGEEKYLLFTRPM